MLDHHHESHRPISLFFRIGSWLLPTVSVESRTSSTSTSNKRLRNRHASKLFLSRHQLALPRLLLPQLRRQLRPEIFRFEHLPNLNLRLARHRIRAALDPLDRLFHRPYLPQPESGNQLLGLSERAIDHAPLRSREPDT